MLKAVIHINELDKWPGALGNVRNILKETQDVAIKVVVNGDAITGYLEEGVLEQMAQLPQELVGFEACRNALNGHKIESSQLEPWIDVVPAGIVRLIELQQEGYAYIKP